MFLDNILKKIKYNSQYQDKFVQDWATYFQYLKSILIEFKLKNAPKESTRIPYFRESRKPLLRAKIWRYGWDSDSFEEIVKKIVNAKAKAALKPLSSTRKTNQHCLHDIWLATANASTQGSLMNNLRVKEYKVKFLKSKVLLFQRLEDEENSKKVQKKKEKWERRYKER